jgi:hypothetical protein
MSNNEIIANVLDVDGHWIFPNKSFTATDLKMMKPSLFHGTVKMSYVLLVHSISLYQSNHGASPSLNER